MKLQVLGLIVFDIVFRDGTVDMDRCQELVGGCISFSCDSIMLTNIQRLDCEQLYLTKVLVSNFIFMVVYYWYMCL